MGNVHSTHDLLHSNPGANVPGRTTVYMFPMAPNRGGMGVGIAFIVHQASFAQNSVRHSIYETLSFIQLSCVRVPGWSPDYIGHLPTAVGKIINVPCRAWRRN